MTGRHRASEAGGGKPPNAAVGDRLIPRMGFVIDVVGYGQRSMQAQASVQIRVRALLEHTLDAIDVEFTGTDHDAGSGDGMAVFLPVATDPTCALPGLLRATTSRLAHDNDHYRDRIQTRMAIGFGLVGLGPLGFTGPLITDLSRLNDSPSIRHAVHQHPHSDLAVLVSNTLHDMIRPDYLPPDLGRLHRVDVMVKEFCATAWLWVSPPLSRHAQTRMGKLRFQATHKG